MGKEDGLEVQGAHDAPIAQRLALQRSLVLAWLDTSDASATANRLVLRRRLGCSPEELVHEAWLRVDSAFARRTEPHPDLETEGNASRYGARVLDNLSRDLVRTALRRGEVELDESIAVIGDAGSDVENRLLVEHLLRAVGDLAVVSPECPGCAPEVVAGAALEALHIVLAGDDESGHGTNHLDRLIYAALERLDRGRTMTAAALRKRKSRCAACIMSLLKSGLREIGVTVA